MNQDKTLQDILEIVQFIKDNAASKADLDRFPTKIDLETRLTEVKTELMTHIDSFIVLHQKLDTELTALRAKYDRLEGYLQQVAKHLQLNFQ